MLLAAIGWIEVFIESNRTELSKLTRWYTTACLALGSDIALWLLRSSTTLG